MGNKLLSAWYFPVFALYSFSIVPSRDSKFNCAKIARLLLTFPTEHPGRCVTAARGASLMTYFVRFPGCQGGGAAGLAPFLRFPAFPIPVSTPTYFLGPSGPPSFFLLPV